MYIAKCDSYENPLSASEPATVKGAPRKDVPPAENFVVNISEDAPAGYYFINSNNLLAPCDGPNSSDSDSSSASDSD